jgi:hypothetical protein
MMTQPIDKPKAQRTDLAAEVASKLEPARARLAALEAQVSDAALASALGQVGAADKLGELNSQIEISRRDVG